MGSGGGKGWVVVLVGREHLLAEGRKGGGRGRGEEGKKERGGGEEGKEGEQGEEASRGMRKIYVYSLFSVFGGLDYLSPTS